MKEPANEKSSLLFERDRSGADNGATSRLHVRTRGRPWALAFQTAISTFLLLLFIGGCIVARQRHAYEYQPDTARIVAESFPQSPFPQNFTWGSATSAYQIEGATQEDHRGVSIWDVFCNNPNNCAGETADIACDHYHKVKEDVAMMKDLGLKAYRFSVAWPRILPMGRGRVNQRGIDFYNTVIDELIANDIEPFVTLYHWDLPQSLEYQYGGWLGPQIVRDFAHYARVCFEAFGDRVSKWITVNEPWTVAIHGYDEGSKAPGRYQRSSTEPYIVGHHLLLAHAEAVNIYRSEFAERRGGVIGIANSGDYRYPLDPENEADVDAANRAIEWQLGWFSDPIWRGDYPMSMRVILGDRLPRFTKEERAKVMGSADFLGLNHYSSALASLPKKAPTIFGEYWADMHVHYSSDPKWETNCMGWSIVPEGGRDILVWIQERYNNPPIYITENGSCEDEPDLDSALHDYGRRDYLEGYIKAFGDALDEGVDLIGYFAWSLMDNFEWGFGFRPRFGIVRVDYDTLQRHPKLSARWYSETIRTNGRNLVKEEATD